MCRLHRPPSSPRNQQPPHGEQHGQPGGGQRGWMTQQQEGSQGHHGRVSAGLLDHFDLPGSDKGMREWFGSGPPGAQSGVWTCLHIFACNSCTKIAAELCHLGILPVRPANAENRQGKPLHGLYLFLFESKKNRELCLLNFIAAKRYQMRNYAYSPSGLLECPFTVSLAPCLLLCY